MTSWSDQIYRLITIEECKAHRRLFLNSLLLFILVSFFCEPAVGQDSPLLIAVEDDADPWSLKDGTGYANDVVTAAFKAVHIEVELRVMPYARCKRMAINGDAVACFSTSPSPELDGVIELSDNPLFTCYSDYFCNVSKPPKVSHEEDLPKKTVIGTVIGYEYPASFLKLVKEGQLLIEESTSESINLKKLSLGRIDLALVNYNETKSDKWLTTLSGVSGKVQIAFRSGVLKSYIGFSVKHPRGAWARQHFNKGYALIASNGTLAGITKLWTDKTKVP